MVHGKESQKVEVEFQFLIGTMKLYLTDTEATWLTRFQFLIGTMKLDKYCSCIRYGLFQFLIGTMKWYVDKGQYPCGYEFQFLIGTMKLIRLMLQAEWLIKFQFLIGTMKFDPLTVAEVGLTSFNSL